jgi:SAM-dependent methyltransferase
MSALATVQNFSGREERYARHRWNYAPAAIDYLAQTTQLNAASMAADIGAGTGMLTEHLLGWAGRVFAIEPNAEMRQTLTTSLGARANLTVLDAYADNTTLPKAAVDLIAVGRAIHWFPPATTRTEFARILKPDGWLAVLRIPCADEALLAALKALKTAENGWNTELDALRQQQAPHSFYFGHENYARLQFPAVVQERWEDFFGRLCSFSVAPTPAHPRFAAFEAAARAVFDRFSTDGQLTVATVTEISLGRMIPAV